MRHPIHTRLAVFDADSTLTSTEGIDLLAEIAGCGDQVAEITARAMAGELDFAESLRARVALLRGQSTQILAEANERTALTKGAELVCRELRAAGWMLGVVSGGFTTMVEPIAETLGIHHVRANVLRITPDGTLDGTLVGEIVDRAGKAAALREWAAADGVPLAATVAIGDGANDIEMLAVAGLAVGFHPKDALRPHCEQIIESGGLDRLLPILADWP